MKLSAHFDEKEFNCKCCGKGGSRMDPKLIAKLECLRSFLQDKPVLINSGYRCKKHNVEVNGAINSMHVQGKAADIRVPGVSIYELYRVANKLFWNGGVGYYRNFVHVDVRNRKARW